MAPALSITVDVTDGLLAVPAVAEVVRDLLEALRGPACAVDGRGRVAAVNRAWEAAAGAAMPGVGHDATSAWQAAADAGDPVAAAVVPALRQVLGEELVHWSASCAGATPDGERWVAVHLRRLSGVGGALVHLADATAAAVAARRDRHLACHDALTGLPNRALVLDRLQEALERSAGGSASVAVVHVDLVAPGPGALDLHGADPQVVDLRDRVLAAAAQRLCAAVGEGDTVGRVGDTRLVVVCGGVADEVEARHVATGLRAAVVTGGPGEVAVQAAVGVALGRPGETASALLDAAGPAPRAAADETGEVRVLSAAARGQAERRARLGRDLRTAVARGELRVDYQPLVAVASGRVDKAEALLRWRHPELGELSPAEFVPIAEETGAIVDVGAWVIGTACRWLASRGPDDRLCVSVNLSAQQLGDDAVVALVADHLAAHGLDASRLVLEVTESAVVADRERSTAVLRDLRALGVGLALDDFGTGYSSLVYLRDFPFDTLKIDRRFVAGLGVDDDDTAIVASVVDLAHAVGMVAVAEGVESTQQLDLLRRLGCDLAQGWLWAPAVPDDELDVVLAALALVPARGRDDPARVEATARERRLRQRARQLQAQGASLHTIAAALNGEGLLTSRGTRWSVQSAAHLVAGLRSDD